MIDRQRRALLTAAFGGVSAIISSSLVTAPGGAADRAEDIVGLWEGKITQGLGDSPLTLEIQSARRWKWVALRADATSTLRTFSEAEGDVDKTHRGFELSGKYTYHVSQRVQGTALRLTLVQVAADELSGNGISSYVNRSFSVSLRRRK